MKKIVMTLALVAGVAGLAACSGNDSDNARYPAPYAHERTAGSQVERQTEVRSSEPVFERQMTK